MALTQETRRILELFIKYAQEMADSSFTKKLVADQGVHFKFNYQKGTGGTMQATHPEPEQTKALILTLRMFKQDDDISLKNLAKLYADTSLSQAWKHQVNNTRAVLNEYLDSQAAVSFNDDHPTNRDILDAILYGELAHPDPAKAARVAKWRVGDAANMMTNFFFQIVVVELLKAIWFIADMTELELAGKPVPVVS